MDKPSILVVEDEKSQQIVIVSGLKDHFYVEVADNCEQAHDFVSQGKKYDLL